MLPKSAEVVIVGGGVIGCATAFWLAKAGLAPLLLERGQLASEASGESAGVLSPPSEHDRSHTSLQFAVLGRWLFSSLSEELRASTGMDIEHRQIGILVPLFKQADPRISQAWARSRRGSGVVVEVLDRKQTLEAEPLLSDKVIGAIRYPEAGHVNARTLVLALAAAARRHGATISAGSPVHSIQREGDKVSGVRSGDGTISTRTVVLAAGSWSGLLGEALGIPIPVSPARGQLVLVRPGQGIPRHIVFSDDTYLIPTTQAEIIMGTTVEFVGYDKRSTVSGVQGILGGASEVIPDVANATLLRTWAGLRPHTPDELPLLGRHPGLDGLILATGHYRSGILLGPLTGLLIQELILDRTPSISLQPFRPDR